MCKHAIIFRDIFQDNRNAASEAFDAYVVVYSVEDTRSFLTAMDHLTDIRQREGREVAVILVANKSDLVRNRVVLEEGKKGEMFLNLRNIDLGNCSCI
jgi:GTPase SAR1 family protein